MDNFSAHKVKNKHTRQLAFTGRFKGFQYHNIYLLFLPPNIASMVQPLHQGIIAVFKTHYHRQHVAFNLTELDKWTPPKDIKVNMLQALQCMREARCHIQGKTISNFWIKTKIYPVIYKNKLCRDANRKVKHGVALFKKEYNALACNPSAPTTS